jgi:pilus assembly protein CpaB
MLGRLLAVTLASLVLACGISMLFWHISSANSGPRMKTRDVVVATAELPVGARIRAGDVRVVAVPQDVAPDQGLSQVAEAKDRVVTSVILRNEPVAPSRLAPPGSAPGLAPMIPPGFRAVSVRVNDVIGVAGFIQPGMRVDVLATGRLAGSEDSVTRTVLQNVVVLSAGQVLQPEPKGQVINAQVVTLQVRPEEAEILTLTSGEGRIQLVLRNSSDNAMATTSGAHLAAIYRSDDVPAARHAAKSPAVAAPPKPRTEPEAVAAAPRKIEVIRGIVRSDVPARDSDEARTLPGESHAQSIAR